MNIVEVTRESLEIKFEYSLKVSSISIDDFALFLMDGATPSATAIASAFKPIDISKHFSSINRTLYLYFNTSLAAGNYRLVADGLQDSASRDLPILTADFVYDFEVLPPEEDDPYERPRVYIEDHSIKNDITFSGESIYAANPDFHIVNTEPANGDIFIDDDERGRITVTFSRRPAIEYINQHFIKVQRKLLGPGLNRWEQIEAKFALDSTKPKLYIYIPSNEATPVYNIEGSEYFISGYKYRVRLSADIAAKELEA